MPDVSIVLATFNERENIPVTIKELFKHIKPSLEVIVVDDNSPDKTGEVVKKMKHPHVKLIERVNAKGLATAFNRGIIESRGKVVGWMDADMCMPPSLLPKMIDHLKKYDIVVGSRYVRGGRDVRSALRVITSRMINWWAGLWLGFDIQDYDSGFVVVRRSVFNAVTLNPRGYGSYFIELLYDAKKKGLKVKEVPYVFRDRDKGVSKSAGSIFTLLALGWEYGWRIIITRLKRQR